ASARPDGRAGRASARLEPHGRLLALLEALDDVGGDLRRRRPRAEARVEAELARELVVDAGPAEEEQHVVAPALLLDHSHERRAVLLVAVALRDDLRDEDRVGPEGPRARAELGVLDLGAEVVRVEALVALEPLLAVEAL